LFNELAGRVLAVEDREFTHKGEPIRDLENVCADRLSLREIRPCAPMPKLGERFLGTTEK
jgi:hypothetical protein